MLSFRTWTTSARVTQIAPCTGLMQANQLSHISEGNLTGRFLQPPIGMQCGLRSRRTQTRILSPSNSFSSLAPLLRPAMTTADMGGYSQPFMVQLSNFGGDQTPALHRLISTICTTRGLVIQPNLQSERSTKDLTTTTHPGVRIALWRSSAARSCLRPPMRLANTSAELILKFRTSRS